MSTYCVCSQALLDSYLSIETNESIARHFIRFYSSKRKLIHIFKIPYPRQRQTSMVPFWRFQDAFKKGSQYTSSSTLSWMKKFSNGFDITTCVFVSFLTIISIHRNKREHHTMFQADFKVPNVGSCTFLGFHTHAKGRLSWCHFGTFKNGFQGT